MELTNQGKAIVFAMYLGCDVRHTLGSIDKLLGVTFLDDNEGVNWFIKVGKDKKNNTWKIAHTHQLLLTPLSKISDEDAIDVWKIRGYTVFGLDKAVLAVKKWIEDNNLSYQQHQHLISKGYAVPLYFAPNHWANGKTAIELGIAIEK